MSYVGRKRKSGDMARNVARSGKRFKGGDYNFGRKYIRTVPLRLRRYFRGFKSGQSAYGVEVKYKDNIKANAQLGASVVTCMQDPVDGCLNNIAVSADVDGREGRKYIVKSLLIRGRLYADVTASATSVANPKVRIIVVHDKQTHGVQMDPAEYLRNYTNNDLSSIRYVEHAKRYVTLFDRIYTIPLRATESAVAGTWSYSAEDVFFKIYKKLNIPVTCTGGTVDIGDIEDSTLHILAFTNDQSVIPTLEYYSRVQFIG